MAFCEVCLNALFPEDRKKLTVLLDSFSAPVAVVDSGGIVLTANSKALKSLGKELGDVEGYAGGDVFECAFANLPQGCGKTEHCSGCTIRNTVVDTYISGNCHLKCQAYLNRGDPNKPHQLDLLISTEKINDLVLLRIDQISL